MSVCMGFPRPRAGFSGKRERYEELIDAMKVVKEQLEKERREKRKERREKDWKIECQQISKIKKTDYKKKSDDHDHEEEILYTPTSGKWKKRTRPLEFKPRYDDHYYCPTPSSTFNSSERRTKRRREHEHETKPFQRSSSLMSWEKKVPALPVAVSVPTTYAYGSTENNNSKKTKTTKKKKKEEEEELSITSETSSSSSCGNISGIDEVTRDERSWWLEKEVLEYKKLELEKMVPPWFCDAASKLPPLDLDWLYPKTTTKKDKDEDESRRAEKRRREYHRKISSDDEKSSLFMGPHAQYLHHVDIFALPYVLPF